MRPVVAWGLLSTAALGVILVPFFLYEQPITAWVDRTAEGSSSPWVPALAFTALLSFDVLLPVPSSLVSTLCGMALGFAGGALASWTGMTLGALLGYALGRHCARGFTSRMVGAAELERASRGHQRWGPWSIVVSRAVPVLAEATVVFAGIAGMSWRRFLLLAGLSNLAVSLVYAAVGAFALRVDSFLLAFSAAIVLPGAAMLFVHWRSRSSRADR